MDGAYIFSRNFLRLYVASTPANTPKSDALSKAGWNTNRPPAHFMYLSYKACGSNGVAIVAAMGAAMGPQISWILRLYDTAYYLCISYRVFSKTRLFNLNSCSPFMLSHVRPLDLDVRTPAHRLCPK
jgi:hypothetical protein